MLSLIHPLFDLSECGQPGSESDQFVRRDQLCELGIDRLNPGPDRRGGRTATVSQPDDHPSAILRVDLPREVAAKNEYVDELAGRLFADSQPPNHVRS